MQRKLICTHRPEGLCDMATESSKGDIEAPRVGQFATTHWSAVFEAGSGAMPDARRALEELCQTYWHPLYVYVRRRGYGVQDAEDLTQEFFALLLRKEHFALPNPARGRFRSFLLTAMQHFLTNEWSKRRAQKRGGEFHFVSWDQQEAERWFASETRSALSPEQLFDKRWAVTVLECVLANLQAECQTRGRGEMFEALKDTLWGESASLTYRELGERWDMSEGAVAAMAHRLRRRYRELLRAEAARTVSRYEEIEQEMRDLIVAVSV
jgi:RNA polymerase sigma-70 factor (ECF subfamily)